jgi:tyrosinase
MILPSITRAQQPTRSLTLRKSVHNLTEEQLDTLRQAFRAVMQIGDNRGYNFHAGIHGLPLGAGQSELYCRHDLRLWLPWHRAYLYLFELALRDQVPDASLPWWDWASPISHSSGIPEAYTESHLDGQLENPLFSAPIPENAQRDARLLGLDFVPEETFRDSEPPNQLPDTPWAVQRENLLPLNELLKRGDLLDFSEELRKIHNYVHVWVGGTMGSQAFAAYDPIFWAHHSMVDRIWRIWQRDHPGASFDLQTLGQALPPFPLTVAEVLDVTTLGYEYASFATDVPGTG